MEVDVFVSEPIFAQRLCVGLKVAQIFRAFTCFLKNWFVGGNIICS
jgi:hypothetical protein